jgi:hypothetical protein
MEAMDGMEHCTKCVDKLPLDRFAVDQSKSTGHKSWCRDCDNTRSRAYYAANRERVIARVSAYNAERRRAA